MATPFVPGNSGVIFCFFNQPAQDVIKSLVESVKRIGIVNAFRNDAYVLELDSVSKNAEIVCGDMWKQFET